MYNKIRIVVSAVALSIFAHSAGAVSINSQGVVAGGVAGGNTCIDNRAVASGGGAASTRWFDDTNVIYQRNDTLTLALIDSAGHVTNLVPRGANTVKANGGVWAAWLSGTGLYASTGLALPNAGLIDVGPDGEIAYTPNYQTGIGGIVRMRDGSEWTLSTGFVVDAKLYGGGKGIWSDGSWIRTTGMPPVSRISPNAWHPRAVFYKGEWWAIYYTEPRGLVAHPFDSPFGYVLRTTPDAFAHDARVVGDNFLVAFATNEAESAGSYITLKVDTTKPRVDLRVTAPPVVDPPKPPPVDPPAVIQIPDGSVIVRAVTNVHPDVMSKLRDQADICDRIRPQLGEDHPDVQACEKVANSLKAKMTRFIADALYQMSDHRWGLRLKTGGTNAARPSDGKLLATDVVMWRDNGQICDVMSDRASSWGCNPGDTQPLDQWVQPLPEDGGTVVNPPPPPTDTVSRTEYDKIKSQLFDAINDRDAARSRINELEAERDDLKSQRDRLTTERDEARQALAELQNRPAPSCEAQVPGVLRSLGIRVGCRIVQK